MLKLQRNIDESVIITTPDGYRVHIRVETLQSDSVRLAFDTCPEVTIVRAELEYKQPPIVRKLLSKNRSSLRNPEVETAS